MPLSRSHATSIPATTPITAVSSAGSPCRSATARPGSPCGNRLAGPPRGAAGLPRRPQHPVRRRGDGPALPPLSGTSPSSRGRSRSGSAATFSSTRCSISAPGFTPPRLRSRRRPGRAFAKEIDRLNERATVLEDAFSAAVGQATRWATGPAARRDPRHDAPPGRRLRVGASALIARPSPASRRGSPRLRAPLPAALRAKPRRPLPDDARRPDPRLQFGLRPDPRLPVPRGRPQGLRARPLCRAVRPGSPSSPGSRTSGSS